MAETNGTFQTLLCHVTFHKNRISRNRSARNVNRKYFTTFRLQLFSEETLPSYAITTFQSRLTVGVHEYINFFSSDTLAANYYTILMVGQIIKVRLVIYPRSNCYMIVSDHLPGFDSHQKGCILT